ncbi:MAG: Gfo/Idh/MocA family oxidoreductase, partial [Clostridia bacterium]|nr:Gfo/Idh/MocA family oxidoreductase [Clostridia bacterium]
MKKIRVGIFGVRRGSNFFDSFLANNAEIVAVCDKSDAHLEKAKEKLGDTITCYKDFDEFIEHPMDAVLLANYFHEHTPYAIRCLEKDI